MTDLKFDDLEKVTIDFVSNANKELIIISPFIKLTAIKSIVSHINPDVKVIVVTRWNLNDLIFGASDLEVYSYLSKFNYKFFINRSIHLKLLLRDKNQLLFGSSNITNKGLGISKNGNIEVMKLENSDDQDKIEIFKIIKNSVEINKDLFERIKNEFNKFDNIKKEIHRYEKEFKYFDNIIKPSINVFVSDFPFSRSPNEFYKNYRNRDFKLPELKHDMELYHIPKSLDKNKLKLELSKAFLSSSSYLWQKNKIYGEVLFGKYSQQLHNFILDDPRPYRKQIKALAANMFSWTEEFSNEFKIKSYNHTKSIVRLTR